jgi:uncharacterized membrane protein
MDHQQRLWFDAEVRPNRALSPQGLRRLFLALATGSILINGGLIVAGQWIAAIFMTFDLGLLGIALLVNTRDLRAVEHIRIDDDHIHILRQAPGHQTEAQTLNVAWARLERAPSRLVEGLEAVSLTSQGKTLTVAKALSPRERADFANALEAALNNRNQNLSRFA